MTAPLFFDVVCRSARNHDFVQTINLAAVAAFHPYDAETMLHLVTGRELVVRMTYDEFATRVHEIGAPFRFRPVASAASGFGAGEPLPPLTDQRARAIAMSDDQ